MAKTLSRLNRLVTRLEDLCLVLAGYTLLVIMVIVTVDVFMRYAVNRPLAFSYDLIGIYLITLAFFFSLSGTFRRNHHIGVDIVYDQFSRRWQRVCRLLVALIVSPFAFWILWLAAVQAESSYVRNDVISGAILWPTWIPSAIVAAGFLLLLVRLLLDALALAVALASGSAQVPGESPERAHTPDKEEVLA